MPDLNRPQESKPVEDENNNLNLNRSKLSNNDEEVPKTARFQGASQAEEMKKLLNHVESEEQAKADDKTYLPLNLKKQDSQEYEENFFTADEMVLLSFSNIEESLGEEHNTQKSYILFMAHDKSQQDHPSH